MHNQVCLLVIKASVTLDMQVFLVKYTYTSSDVWMS